VRANDWVPRFTRRRGKVIAPQAGDKRVNHAGLLRY